MTDLSLKCYRCRLYYWADGEQHLLAEDTLRAPATLTEPALSREMLARMLNEYWDPRLDSACCSPHVVCKPLEESQP